jgi:hypothetical protein
MRILLVGDYPADPRLGSAKVYYKLREEFAALGHDCDLLMAAEIGARPANWRRCRKKSLPICRLTSWSARRPISARPWRWPPRRRATGCRS